MHSIVPQEENPALRDISKEIPTKDIRSARVKKLIEEMKGLLSQEEYGVALAAVQLGEPVRLFIVSGRALARGARNAPDEAGKASGKSDSPGMKFGTLRGGKSDSPVPSSKFQVPIPDQVYINPRLLKTSRGKINKHEGCLSIRGKWGIVPRAEKATIRAFDEAGREFTRGATGFLAHIFQHEMDHLEGILYTDKAIELYDEKKTQEN